MADAPTPSACPVSLPTAREHALDPPPRFAELRERSPITRLALPDGTRGWLVTDYELACDVLVDQRFSARQDIRVPPPGQAPAPPAAPGFFVRMDAPDPAALDRNYAGEPRDSFRLDGVSVTAIGEGGSRDDLHFDGALFRAAQMAGAMERVLDMTVAYAKERAQFGRTISKFQAVQQQIARLAGEAAAASAASHAAGDARSLGPARFETACAKLRAGEAAGEVAAIAHQVHGAVGFTHEYHLHFLTRRLWSWRDEFGSEAEWNRMNGRAIAAAGADHIWATLSAG